MPGQDKIFVGGVWKTLGGGGGGGGGGSATFIGLTDVPATYAGSGSKVVSVKSDASGLEFTTPAVTGTPADGWVAISNTLTYASASTFTVPTDLTATYQKGTKIKLTDGTVKYFYVLSSAYGAPNTTVTVTGGTDYTLSGGAITAPYYSYIENPQGFPDWFNYTPTVTASGAMTIGSLVVTKASFSIKGRTVLLGLKLFFTLGGTTSSTVFATLPVEGNAIGDFAYGVGSFYDASSSVAGWTYFVAGTPDYVGIKKYDGSNMSIGAGRMVTAQLFYVME
jgi:hypothetical protein